MYLGTDRFSSCSENTNHPAWPPDFNNDKVVNIIDVLSFKQTLNTTSFDSNFNKRYDLNTDNQINILDILELRPYFNKSCATSFRTPASIPSDNIESVPEIPPSPSNPEHAVVPIIYLPKDTAINKDSYRQAVDKNFNEIRAWYYKVFGKTFDLEPALLTVSNQTEAEIYQNWGPVSVSLWIEGTKETLIAHNKAICNPKRLYYFVSPMTAAGGTAGAEWLGCSTHGIPGNMGKLIGDIIDPDWPEQHANEPIEAQGGVAHEIAHNFGADCYEIGCGMLPHSVPWIGSIMFEWQMYRRGTTFTDEEKNKISNFPFMHILAGPCYPYGDANSDNGVSISDSLIIQQYINNPTININLENSDVSNDGQVTNTDAILISEYLTGNTSTFPICNATTP